MNNEFPNSKKFYLLGLCLALLASGAEIYSWSLTEHDWATLYSTKGIIALALVCMAFLAGLLLILLNLFSPPITQKIANVVPSLRWIRWLFAAGFLLTYAWIFLFSPWAADFPSPWTQYTVALSFACLIAFVMDNSGNRFGPREVFLALALFIYTGSIAEIRAFFLSGFASRLGILIEGILLVGVIYLLYSGIAWMLGTRFLEWRSHLGRSSWLVLAAVLLSPLILRALVGPSVYWFNFSLRFALLIFLTIVATFLLQIKSDRLISVETGLLGLGLVLLLLAFTNNLYSVTTYPFSLSWSEGNRFYDYSMIFGQKIYDAALPIVDPYTQDAPGRFVLWGLPFLFSSLPIWFHRLWGIILSIVPPLLFGWLVGQPIKDGKVRIMLALWIGLLFIVVSPVYAPILLSAIVVILSVFDSSLLKRVVFVIIAAIYASLSRWTWFLAPAAWAGLTDLLLYYPQRKSSFIQKILPTAILVISGVGAGYLIGKRNVNSYAASDSLANAQPLLWYRLFPNQTFSMGIILGTLIVTGPLLVLLIWWMASRRWKLDWLQMFSIWAILISFLGAGLVVSTKIGGGGNLHNLDMYLISLTFVFALGISSFWKQGQLQLGSWPFWTQAVLCWALFIIVSPFTSFAQQSTPATLSLPPSVQVQQTLNTIRTQVAQASTTGEVLFMDERQLLTFGYIRNVPLISDYEKKYMMDQAMGANAGFFKQYYQDLAQKRFVLIVSEPLKHVIKSQDSGPFSDENDAWVKWVSDPTLCFYQPIFTDPANRVQLLVPRTSPLKCDQYLSGG